MMVECPHCKSTKLTRDYERAELICTGCGFVLQDRILDRGPDWYAFEADKRRHTGPPVSELIHDRGISSRMSRGNRDALGRTLTPETVAKFGRLRRWDQRAHFTNSERTLSRALHEQSRICHNLGLPKFVQERAALLFRRAAKERMVRGRSVEAIAATVIYIVSKELGLRRGLDELARESGVDPRDLKRAYSLLARKFCIRPSPIEPIYYASDIVKRLGLEECIRRRAFERIVQQHRKTISEKEILKMVAAAIYAACVEEGGKINKTKIAKAINLSRASFSKYLKESTGAKDADATSTT